MTGGDFTIYVWDNANDGILRDYLEAVGSRHNGRYVRSDVNIGFGAAANSLLASASEPFVVFLNSDCVVPKNWTALPIDVLQEDDEIGACGPIVKRVNDRPYIEGSCLFMRTDEAKRYGPFDPLFEFMYWEDTDLSFRLMRDGYKLAAVPVDIYHQGHASRDECDVDVRGIYVCNDQRFWSRWRGWVAEPTDFTPTAGDRERAARNFPGRLVTICPQGRFPTGTYWHSPALCEAIIDRTQLLCHTLRNSTPPRYARAVLERSDLIVGVDGPLCDIAREIGVPVLEIAGPTSSELALRHDPLTIHRGLQCLGCITRDRQHPRMNLKRYCPHLDGNQRVTAANPATCMLLDQSLIVQRVIEVLYGTIDDPQLRRDGPVTQLAEECA